MVNETPLLKKVLDQYLSLLDSCLTRPNFERFLHKIWGVLVAIFVSIVESNCDVSDAFKICSWKVTYHPLCWSYRIIIYGHINSIESKINSANISLHYVFVVFFHFCNTTSIERYLNIGKKAFFIASQDEIVGKKDFSPQKKNAEFFSGVFTILERTWHFFTHSPTNSQGLDPQLAHTVGTWDRCSLLFRGNIQFSCNALLIS